MRQLTLATIRDVDVLVLALRGSHYLQPKPTKYVKEKC